MLNFVGHVEQDDWISESWTEPGSVDDLRAAYAGWHPQVQRVIDAVDETFIWAVLDRPPIDALDLRPDHHAGRRLSSDDPVHGSGRRAGDRGRRRDHGLPA